MRTPGLLALVRRERDVSEERAHARRGGGRAARSRVGGNRQPVPRAAKAPWLRQRARKTWCSRLPRSPKCAKNRSNSSSKRPRTTRNKLFQVSERRCDLGERTFCLKVAVNVEGSVGWPSMRSEASFRRDASEGSSRFPRRPSSFRRRTGGTTDTGTTTAAAACAARIDRRARRGLVDLDRQRRMGERRDACRGWARSGRAHPVDERRGPVGRSGAAAGGRSTGAAAAEHATRRRYDRRRQSAAGCTGGRSGGGGILHRCGGLGGGTAGQGFVWEGEPGDRWGGCLCGRSSRAPGRQRPGRRVGEGTRRLDQREHVRGAPYGHGDPTRR